MIRVKNAIRKNVSDIKKNMEEEGCSSILQYFFFAHIGYAVEGDCCSTLSWQVLAYLMGNYYDSKATYEKLFDWTDEHKFKTGKYSYKEAVIDELATASPSEYLTKISIQVF